MYQCNLDGTEEIEETMFTTARAMSTKARTMSTTARTMSTMARMMSTTEAAIEVVTEETVTLLATDIATEEMMLITDEIISFTEIIEVPMIIEVDIHDFEIPTLGSGTEGITTDLANLETDTMLSSDVVPTALPAMSGIPLTGLAKIPTTNMPHATSIESNQLQTESGQLHVSLEASNTNDSLSFEVVSAINVAVPSSHDGNVLNDGKIWTTNLYCCSSTRTGRLAPNTDI